MTQLLLKFLSLSEPRYGRASILMTIIGVNHRNKNAIFIILCMLGAYARERALVTPGRKVRTQRLDFDSLTSCGETTTVFI